MYDAFQTIMLLKSYFNGYLVKTLLSHVGSIESHL